MLAQQRTTLIVALAVVLLAAVLLAGGLSGVELRPGVPLRTFATPAADGAAPAPLFDLPPGVLRAFILIMAIMMPFALVYFVVSKEVRKRVIQQALWLAAISYLAYLWLQGRGDALGLETPQTAPDLESLPSLAGEPAPGALLANPPDWLVLGVAAVVVLALLWAMRLVWLRLSEPGGDLGLVELGREAERAAREIEAGADFKDAVTRCYADMSRVLSEQRGISRGQAVTPREFERRLLAAGLPAGPVSRLTRLFEGVRYGGAAPAADEQQAALEALRDIAAACGASL